MQVSRLICMPHVACCPVCKKATTYLAMDARDAHEVVHTAYAIHLHAAALLPVAVLAADSQPHSLALLQSQEQNLLISISPI